MSEHPTDYHQEHPDWPEGFEPGTEQDLDVGTIVYVTVVGTLITILVVLLLKHMFFKAHEEELVLKSYATVYQPKVDLQASQLQQLEAYGWKDAQNGVIRIPINVAMAQVVEHYGSGKGDEIAPAPAAAASPAETGTPPAAPAETAAQPAAPMDAGTTAATEDAHK